MYPNLYNIFQLTTCGIAKTHIAVIIAKANTHPKFGLKIMNFVDTAGSMSLPVC
jgi:hypothetical protein